MTMPVRRGVPGRISAVSSMTLVLSRKKNAAESSAMPHNPEVGTLFAESRHYWERCVGNEEAQEY
jgi:hypothetical protein